MAELMPPTSSLYSAWAEARAEWGPGVHEDGFGLLPTDDVDTRAGFEAWVARLQSAAAPAGSSAGCLYRWIVDGDEVLGGIALRYGDWDIIQQAGHIGYGIKPSARRRGLAGWALGQMVGEAGRLGIDRVLLVCEVDNEASATTIERNGGVLERIEDTDHGPMRRYWIETVQ